MSTPTPTPIPIILCGKNPDLAKNVTNALLPEIEVIHVFITTPSFTSLAPLLLSSSPPPASLSQEPNIGSQDYSKPILAVVTGGGYNDDDVKVMREACEGKRGVVWLRPDMQKERPPLGPEYGKFVVGCVKECLGRLGEEGKLEKEGNGEVYYY